MTDLLDGLPDQADGTKSTGGDPLLAGLPDAAPPSRPAVLRAGQYQPDQYVEAERTGAELGLQPDVVARNPDEVRRIQQQRALDGLRKRDPDLANWLTEGQNLTVAQDDVGTLEQIASGMQTIGNYAGTIPRGFNQGIGSGLAGLGELMDAGAYGLSRLAGGEQAAQDYMKEAGESAANPANWLRSLGQFVKEGGVQQKIARFAMDHSPIDAVREMRTPFEAVPETERNLAIDVGEGLGNLGGQAAATIANPAAGLALLLGQGADQQAQIAKESGQYGSGEAYAAIVASAPVAAALEKIGLSRVLKYAPPGVQNSVARYVVDKLAAAGVEATTEAAEQVAYNALANLYTDQGLAEGVQENFTVGGAVGGIARVIVGARYARTRAEREGEMLDVLGESSAASALRQRDPARFRQLVDQLASKGADRVYLNAEQAQQYFQSAALDPTAVGIDPEAMAEAVALGGDVTIPMTDWLTTVAPEHGKALGQFARLTPHGLDRAQLATFDEEVDGAAVRFLDSIYEAEQGRGAVRDVYNDVLGQQLANGTPQVEAEAQAALIQRAFDYLGGPGDGAWKLYQQYGLKVVQERPDLVEALARRPNVEAAIDSLIDRLRAGDYPKDDRVSLADFLADGGGVTDAAMTGEIATLEENDRVVRKGKKRLVRADADRDLDRAREAAAEAGYLPMDTDVNDLLALLDEEMGGRPVYASGDESTRATETRQAMDELAEELGRLGIDVSQASNEDIKRALFSDDGGMLDQSGDDYRMQHRAPGREEAASLSDLTDNGIYPDDIYSRNGPRFYGTGSELDAAAFRLVNSYRGNPDAPVTIYRAVPEGVDTINSGDWVAIVRQYAEDHAGDAPGWHVISRQVRAGDIFTNGDSIQEWGFDPEETTLNQSATDQTQTPEFKAWFGESKVVGANGEPLVVYHGSPDARFVDEDGVFKSQRERYGFGKEAGAHWFASSPETARSYMDPNRAFDYQAAEPGMVAAFLKIENPLIVDAAGAKWRDAQKLGKTGDIIAKAQADGHDGVIIRNVRDNYQTGVVRGDKATDTYLVFDSNQIKSATANRGTFDPNDPSILNQADGTPTRRGFIQWAADRQFSIGLTQNADRSTFFHEAGHFLLEVMADMAADPSADPALRQDFAAIQKWWADQADHVLATLPHADRDAINAAGGADLIKRVASDFRGDHGAATQAARTALHEYTARGFERYLAEGKAPTPETAGMFARLRAWMLEVYKTLSALNVNLSDDVRGVFDRMIAGDRAIQRAEAAAGMEPLFKEARTLGWSDTRFGEYLRLMAAGHEEAEARMASRAIEEVAREHRAWWREESASVQREVEAELHAEPVYQAWANLQHGTQPDGSPLPDGVKAVKLDKDWLVDRYGQDFLNKHLLRKQVYAVDGGVNPDLVAVTYGFRDGNELVSALANALPLKTAVKAETQSRMRARHGDMRMDPQLPEQAARSIHNSKTMKAIELEVAALEELTNTPKMSPAAVREWARRKVAGTRVRDLTPYQYLRAERKHAREAVVAAGKGDMVAALTASRRRLANAVLYAEAAKARDTAEKRGQWLKAQAKKSTQEKLGKAGMIYRDSVNDVLASLGLRQPTAGEIARKKPLRQSVDTLHEQGNEVSVAESVILRVDAGRVVDPRELTVTEFTEAWEAVKSLKHVAGQQNKLLATDAKVTRDEAIAEMVARAEEVLPDRLPEALSARDRSTVQAATDKVAKLFGEMDRPENVIEALDGGESGPWHAYYWGALERAEAIGVAYRRKLATALRDLRKSLPKSFMADLGADVTLPFGPRVSRNTLIGIVLNTGNATNLQRLKDGGIHYQGRPLTLTDDQVQTLRDLLTPEEARYVQGLWDTVNSLWPDIVTLQTEMTGIPPEKVEAQAFKAGGIEMRGGYWPLAYDHAKSDIGERQSDDDAMRLMMGQGYSRAVTPKGYTKSRAENVNAALQLDFGTMMSRHLDNVMTDLAYRKAVKDITAFMRAPAIKDAIIGRLGQHAYDNLKGALAYSVSPSDMTAQAASMWRAFQGKIISNAAVSALAIRPDIALGNYASALVQAVDRAGVRALARGWWEFNTRRAATTARIVSLSPFMAERLGEIDYHYRQEIGKTQGRTGFGDAYKRVMMTLHRQADHDVTRAAWWGRYKNELDGGATQAEAIRLADTAIRQTQTAAGRKDVSPLERDPAFRESRMFMGPMFVIMGRMRAAARGEGAVRSVGQRAASLMLQVMVAPAIFMLAAGRWPEDDDDEEGIGPGDWAWWLARNTFLFPMQAMPIVREAGAAIEAALTDKPISPRAAPTAQAVAGLVKSSREIARNVENYQDTGEMDWTEMTRDLAVGVGPLTGMPSSQIRITTKTVDAVLDDPDRQADEFARMAIYGPPRE